MCLLYVATPKTLSGIFLISVRLPVLAGMLALLLAGEEAMPRALKVVLLCVTFTSLAETAAWHHRFATEIDADGLAKMIATPPPDKHGYVSLEGRTLPNSKQVYLDHLGQWWTAKWGRVGHNFFADAP